MRQLQDEICNPKCTIFCRKQMHLPYFLHEIFWCKSSITTETAGPIVYIVCNIENEKFEIVTSAVALILPLNQNR